MALDLRSVRSRCASAILFCSKETASLLILPRQPSQLSAWVSPVWVFIPNPFNDTLRQSLKRFFCSPCERFSLQVQQRTVFRGANTFSIAFAEGIRQYDCEHHAEQRAGKDTALLDTVGDREYIGSRILHYLILRRACHQGINAP